MTTEPAGWYPDPTNAAPARTGGDGQPHDLLLSAPARTGGAVRKVLLAGAAGVAVLGVAGGAYAFAMLSGGGAQPEDALPGNAVGYAEIDLDPAAGQKVAVYELARKFPRAELTGQDNLKDDLLEQVLGDGLPEGLTYDANIKPWVGDRAGVAVLPELDEDDEPHVALALQYTDEGAARTNLSRIASVLAEREPDSGGGSDTFAFTFGADGYLVIAETQQIADKAVADAADRSLSSDEDYRRALEALGGDQIATAWVDLGRIYDIVPAADRDEFFNSGLFAPDTTPSGAFVVGASAGSDHLQLAGRAVDLETGLDSEGTAGLQPGSDLIRAMPADALGALSITGLGDAFARFYDQAVASTQGPDPVPSGGFGLDIAGILDSFQAQSGLDLPEDFRAVLGEELAVAVFGEELEVGVRVRGGDPQRALEMERTLGGGYGLPSGTIRDVDGDIVGGSSPEAVDQVSRDGGLGGSDAFDRAVPNAEDAGFVLYLDVPNVLAEIERQGDGFLDREDLADLEPLQAVGISAVGGESGSFTMRVTVR